MFVLPAICQHYDINKQREQFLVIKNMLSQYSEMEGIVVSGWVGVGGNIRIGGNIYSENDFILLKKLIAKTNPTVEVIYQCKIIHNGQVVRHVDERWKYIP